MSFKLTVVMMAYVLRQQACTQGIADMSDLGPLSNQTFNS